MHIIVENEVLKFKLCYDIFQMNFIRKFVYFQQQIFWHADTFVIVRQE